MCLTLAFEIYVTFRRSVIYGLSLYTERVLTAQLSTWSQHAAVEL
jgi:hypothetical protein